MKLAVVPMGLDDISQVLEVDRESYTLPWPASAYRREILHNRNARYLVLQDVGNAGGAPPEARDDGHARHPFSFLRWPIRTSDGQPVRSAPILGYAGMWLMVDEAHITTIAVRSGWRGQGLGELLLVSLIDAARDMKIGRVTLEVRVTNLPAQHLYRKYGFEQQGVRPRYYSDNNEDAYIMTTSDIQDPAYHALYADKLDSLRNRLNDGQNMMVEAPAFEHVPWLEPAQDHE